ncbi:MAG: FadR family transcriptional regulator [Hyphomicrobiaceae bacterium]|nr:MAG: FadR family transcriptional regulator [Hyphomicrobiaceae bacterium]
MDGLVSQLLGLIDDPAKGPQSRLPAERDLAEQLGVSRARLRRALAVLEAEGRVWRHVGQGTFVGRRPPVDDEIVTRITRITNPAEVMETRLVIEPKIAALAALRATGEHVGHMESCLRKGAVAEDLKTYELWDVTLHRTIAEAAGNTLLLTLFNAVSAARQGRVWGRLKEATLTDTHRDFYIRQHRDIVASIRDRDAGAAERLMRVHLESVRVDLLTPPPESSGE